MPDPQADEGTVAFPDSAGLISAAQALFVDHDPHRALALVEHESAFVLFERSERRRVGLDGLRSLGYSHLLEAYLALARQASQRGTVLLGGTGSEYLRAVTAELTRLTEEIRAVPGYETFLAPPTFPSLKALDYPDPVVWVVSLEQIGFALILEPGPAGRLLVLTLPDLIAGRAYAQAIHAWFAYRQSTADAADAAIDAVAQWCWAVCLGPVVAALNGVPQATVIPVGVTQLLPLHVAWSPSSTGRTYLSDRLKISIAPNLRLAAANRGAAATASRGVAAFAPQSQRGTTALAQLRWSAPEVNAVTRGAGSRAFLDADATLENLLSCIGSFGCVHFAGHALASISVPWASHLQLFDGPATIAAIADAQPSGSTQLGVLSCCTGALGSAVVPTPGVTIAGVLLAGSFRRLVASLWRVRDDYGAILMARFHHNMTPGFGNSLDALIAAQYWLRDAPLDEVRSFARDHHIDERWVDDSRTKITSWGAFFHAGPCT